MSEDLVPPPPPPLVAAALPAPLPPPPPSLLTTDGTVSPPPSLTKRPREEWEVPLPGGPKPPKKQRNRQQLSCTSCHARKQACDKQVPCARCIKRGVADECHIEGKPRVPTPQQQPQHQQHPHSAASNGHPSMLPSMVLPSLQQQHGSYSKDQQHTALAQRVHVLEAALRSTTTGQADPLHVRQVLAAGSTPSSQSSSHSHHGMSGSPYPSSGKMAASHDVETAAAALGQLARESTTSGSFIEHHGPGSVASLLNAGPGSSATARVVSAHPSTLDPAIAALVAAIPPRPLADFLVATFYHPSLQMLLDRFIVTRQDIFEAGYRKVLDWRDSLQLLPGLIAPLPTSISFLASVSVILATALQFLPDNALGYVNQFCDDYRVLESHLRAQAKAALDMSEAEEPPDLYRVEATLHQALYLKNCGRPNTNYSLVAQAIRTAQAMGMHREGATAWGLSPFEAEMRRRMWWTLYSYDRCSNFVFGRPYIINDIHCDVALPANVDLSHYDPLDPRPIIPRPLHENTPVTFSLFEIQLAAIIGEVSDRLFSARPHSYADVLECERKMLDWESALPASFRQPSYEDLQRCPQLAIQSTAISLQIIWTRTMLHRPYLLRKIPSAPQPDHYARSRAMAVTLSQKVISIQRDIQMNIPREHKRFFLLPFQMFDSATNLALSILQEPHNSSHVESLDAWVLEARSALDKMGPDNVVAVEAIRVLDALRFKASKLVSVDTRMGYIHPVPAGPMNVPYVGGRADFGTGGGVVGPTSPKSLGLPTPTASITSGTTPPPQGEDSLAWLSAMEEPTMEWPLGIGALEIGVQGGWERWIEDVASSGGL